MSEEIIKELCEAGITVNGRPIDELPDVLYSIGYQLCRAHGLSIEESHKIAMEGLK